ncbi:MAG TPA: transporter substrate-binding domain-containing protein [Nocardioides sp.]|uniref:substrate-binding periplasmic protein n=1 Tax=uncultured Nocardioides sp. TaxID=198441 RepID=UPI00260B2F66|nr:transporter substrate-binding domain-containing protein [uncultured Nocardioides sp.]HRI94298.1 transporter substrate-binding domain-containing protein [Nocardioides sp.]HRK44244.1 transporter substrate-binding domain-containing protein [Nocardioides sp.]
MTSNTTKWVVGIAMSLSLSALTACTSSSADSQKDVAAPEDCTPEHDVTTVEDGVLTVAAVNVPPVVVSSDNDFEGLEPTLIKKFAEANCLSVKANTMDFAATIPAIQSGRADIAIGGYYRTAERAKVVALSNPVWLDQMGIASESGISTVDGLEDVKVGTVDGYLWVPELQDVLGSNLTVYPSAVALKADLDAGRIEAAVDSTALADAYDGFTMVAAEPDDRVQSTIQPAQVGFPMTMDNSSLETAVNDAIAEWQADGAVADALTQVGMPAELAQVGEPRLIQ